MTLEEEAILYHQKFHGKIGTEIFSPITTKKDLSLAYTPGVGAVSKAIAQNKDLVFDLTNKKHTVAVVSDGSAVLGLGNIGPEAALPVMEGKAALFKTFAGVDAVPICLATQESQKIIETVKFLAPTFGGINLEDISAPRCFEIEDALQDLGIPVMHDDQHGTAVVVLAGLINAARVVGKKLSDLTVVISGAGAAGQAIANILLTETKNIIVLDSKGAISKDRQDLDVHKKILAEKTNHQNFSGDLEGALKDADVFIGVSKAGLLDKKWISQMAEKPIIFALANPVPEIMPDEATEGGAAIVATGRSDFPNQVNNSLAFPGIFKGALDSGAKKITMEMKVAAAKAIAGQVPNPNALEIIPGPFSPNLAQVVANAVSKFV